MSDKFTVSQDEATRRAAEKNNRPEIQRWDVHRGNERWSGSPTQEQARYIADLLNKAPPPPLPSLDKLYPKITIVGDNLDKILDNAVVSSAPLRAILASQEFQQRLRAGEIYLFDRAIEPYTDHLSKPLAAAVVDKIWVDDAGRVMAEMTPFGQWGQELSERAKTGFAGRLTLIGETSEQKFEYETTSKSFTLIEYISIDGLWLKPHR